MKCDAKTSSKNLGKLMKSGDTKPTHPIPNHSKRREADSDEEIEVEIVEDLNQFDLVSYEGVLKSIASSKTNLLKNASTKSNRATFSIMGLVDDAKQPQTAESGENSTSTPVHFEEIDAFIDSGEEEVIGKPQPAVAKKRPSSMNVTSPICGNPVTDFDKMNEMNDNNEAEGTSRLVTDPVSLMEMGNPLGSQEKYFEQVDLEKINKSQKNINCDESEQVEFLKERKLDQFKNYGSILGPVSKGEFVSFNQSLSPVVGCDLGVLNQLTTNNFEYYSAAAEGQLLAAIPRSCYLPSDRIEKRQLVAPTTARKLPVSRLLRPGAPSVLIRDPHSQISYSSPLASKMRPPTVVEAPPSKSNGDEESPGAPPGSVIQAASDVDGAVDSHNIKNEDNGTENKDGPALSTTEKNRLKRQREKAKKAEESAKRAEEAAARRAEEAAKKAEETAKKAEEATKKAEEAAKKAEEAAKQKAEEAAKQKGSRGNLNEKTEKPLSGVGSAQQDDSSKNQQSSSNARRSIGQGSGKNKKTEKGVSSEYTVALPAANREEDWVNTVGGSEKEAISGHGDQGLERALKELGIIDVSELVENPSKKKNKGNKKGKQQQQQKKEAPRSTSEKGGSNDGADKNKKQQQGGKKMEEGADAAPIANRSASGAGQQSEEDDDQSYVSAQENLGGSNSQLSTPPAEFADAPQARDDANDHDNVMNDPANYRDDEEVELIALQLQKEEEDFITVGKNNKKQKNKGSAQDNVSSTSSSNSPPNRRNTNPDTRASSATGSNTASSSGPGQASHNQHQRSNNRQVGHPTNLGDFMESIKKETHKNTKHRKTGGPSPATSQKKQVSLDDPPLGSPTLTDAVETPISVNTAPAFSYADVAKKTSGENTPALEMSPVPAAQPTTSSTSSDKNQSMSSASQSSTSERKKSQENVTPKAQLSTKALSTAVSGVQLPASVTATACDISFGYEETPEDKLKREKKEAEAAACQNQTTVSASSPQKPNMPTRMNGADFMKTFNDGNGQNAEGRLQEMPKDGLNESRVLSTEMINSFKAQWDKFENTGSKPIMFKPSTRN